MRCPEGTKIKIMSVCTIGMALWSGSLDRNIRSENANKWEIFTGAKRSKPPEWTYTFHFAGVMILLNWT